MKKRILGIALAICFVLTLLPISAFAATAVAQVDGVDYETFAEAVEAANGTQTILLLENITEAYTMTPGQTILVEKDGKTLTTPVVEGAYVVSYSTTTTTPKITTYTTEAAKVMVTSASGTVSYKTSFPLSYASNGSTITLLEDVECGRSTFGSVSLKNATVVLDLGGNTMTVTSGSTSFPGMMLRYNNTLIVRNGNLVLNDTGDLNVCIGLYSGATLTLEETVNVTSNGGTTVFFADSSACTLNTAATIVSNGDTAIQGNGSYSGSVTNITGGSVTSVGSVAIYQPQNGTLNISGGTVSGTTAVYVKSGTVNITGGTLAANGEAGDYTYNGSGCDSTGDAIVIDSCGYPGGDPVVSITDGTFTSENGDAIGNYAYGESEAQTGFVSGGTFSTALDGSVCATGFEPAVNEDGTYGVVPLPVVATVGEAEFYSFADAVEAANGTETIVLLESVTEAYTMTPGQTILVNKNGKSLKTPVVEGPYVVTSSYTSTTPKIYTYTTEAAKVMVTSASGTVSYKSSFPLSYASNGSTITLLDDVSISRSTFGSVSLQNATVVLDLNGHTLTANNSSTFPSMLLRYKNNLIVRNGNLVLNDTGDLNVCIGLYSGASLTLEETVNVTSNGGTTVFFADSSACTLNTAATIVSNGDTAIQGNGSYSGSVTNITGGSVTSVGSIAIYQPQNGTLNISGGTVSGTTAVYVKSGTVNITGGTLEANGEAGDYTYDGSGCNSTGDAIVIDSCGYPGGDPAVSITGGTFTSENADAIGNYAYGESAAQAGFVSGGTFSTAVEESACAAGYAPKGNADGTFGVTTANNTASIKLGGKIGANFYIDAASYFEDADVSGAYVTLTYNHNTDVYSTEQATDTYALADMTAEADGRYRFTAAITPAQINETILVQLCAANGAVLFSKEYSVKQFCDAAIAAWEGGEYDNYAQLCKALVNYAHYAKIYFNYETSNPIISEADLAANTYGDISAYSPADAQSGVITQGINADTFKLTGMYFKSLADSSIRFTYTGSADGLTITLTKPDGKDTDMSYEFGESDQGQYIAVKGIESGVLDDMFTLTITDGTDTTTVVYSAMSYFKTAIDFFGSDANFVNLCRAISQYNAAANLCY
ncbi:MAG: beta strand repeat-containing protein [Acutalibacteraceae bacterium]